MSLIKVEPDTLPCQIHISVVNLAEQCYRKERRPSQRAHRCDISSTSLRRHVPMRGHYVAFTSVRRHVLVGFEMRCFLRFLNISCKDHVTNEDVCKRIQAAIGEFDELLSRSINGNRGGLATP